MEYVLVACCSFLVTLLLTFFVMQLMRSRGKTGIDRHKSSKPIIPEMGGLALFPGICIGYLALYHFNGYESIFPILITLFLVWIIGVLDDIVALRQKTKLLLLFASGIPLAYSQVGVIDLILFQIDGGIAYYALVLVGIAASSNLTNLLEGFNGEAVGLGVISTFFMFLNGLLIGNDELVSLSLIICFSLAGLLAFNKYPARTFPGDTGTLLIGGAVGALAISQSVELVGVIVLLPQIVEFLMKSTVRFQGVSFGPTQVDENGILHPPSYASVANSITRRMRLKEQELVFVIWTIGILCGLASSFVAYIFY